MENEIIVIPDIHGRTFWKEAVEKYPDADTIFLGDYLDPYPHEGVKHREAYDNFLEILDYARTHKNVTLLFGNHDLVYWFPYDWGRRDHGREDEILVHFWKDIDLLHFFTLRQINGKTWLFSHAPLFEEWIEYTNMPHDLKEMETKLWQIIDGYDRINCPKYEDQEVVWRTLGRASDYRGGIDKCGSPVWADVREIADGSKLYKDADYHVFGHTQQNEPIITDTYACLDTHQAYKITPEGKIESITEKHTPPLPEGIH